MDTDTQQTDNNIITGAGKLLQDIQQSRTNFGARTAAVMQDADNLLKEADLGSTVSGLKKIEVDTAAKLDETILGYVEDLDTNGDDFSSLE